MTTETERKPIREHSPTWGSASDSVDDEEDTNCFRRAFPIGFKEESRELWRLAFPLILSSVAEFFNNVIVITFCGHLGKQELATAALSISLINITCEAVSVGMSSACDTYFAQIYGSAHKDRLGLALQKSLLIIPALTLPCWALHLNAERLLLFLGQDPDAARLAGRYLLIYMPATLAVLYPIVAVGFVQNILNIVLHYVLLNQWSMGTDGSAISNCTAKVLFLILEIAYIQFSGVYKETWTGFSSECLQDWGGFCELGIGGAIVDSVEWWALEVSVYMAGVLGTTQLDSQSVLLTFETLQYMLPYGIGIASSIRVGQYLGAGNKSGAITTARGALVITSLCGWIWAIFFFALRQYVPYILTSVGDVITLVTTVIPFMALYMAFDISVCCVWILKGCGKQVLVAFINTCAYVLMVVLAYVLMFKTSLGIKGFWISICAVKLLLSVIYFTIVTTMNWDKLIEQASKRIGFSTEDYGCLYQNPEHELTEHYDANHVNIEDQDTRDTADFSNHQETEMLSKDYKSNNSYLSSISISTLLQRLFYFLTMFAIFVGGVLLRFYHPLL